MPCKFPALPPRNIFIQYIFKLFKFCHTFQRKHILFRQTFFGLFCYSSGIEVCLYICLESAKPMLKTISAFANAYTLKFSFFV
jgi:hypothetical protein